MNWNKRYQKQFHRCLLFQSSYKVWKYSACSSLDLRSHATHAFSHSRRTELDPISNELIRQRLGTKSSIHSGTSFGPGSSFGPNLSHAYVGTHHCQQRHLKWAWTCVPKNRFPDSLVEFHQNTYSEMLRICTAHLRFRFAGRWWLLLKSLVSPRNWQAFQRSWPRPEDVANEKRRFGNCIWRSHRPYLSCTNKQLPVCGQESLFRMKRKQWLHADESIDHPSKLSLLPPLDIWMNLSGSYIKCTKLQEILTSFMRIRYCVVHYCDVRRLMKKFERGLQNFRQISEIAHLTSGFDLETKRQYHNENGSW